MNMLYFFIIFYLFLLNKFSLHYTSALKKFQNNIYFNALQHQNLEYNRFLFILRFGFNKILI